MNDKQKSLIREVFMRNGFTVKAGKDDLADYVYAAAYELLQTAPDVEALLEALTPQALDWMRCGLAANGHLQDGDHPALANLREALAAHREQGVDP